jgi:hypothetical protein
VHGTILYHGKPLARGTVVLISPDNSTSLARIADDGSYVIESAARGLIHVSIQAGSPRPTPRAAPNSKGAALKARSSLAKEASKTEDEAKMAVLGSSRPQQIFPPGVSERYGDPNKSGLSFELKDPDQEWSVDLK